MNIRFLSLVRLMSLLSSWAGFILLALVMQQPVWGARARDVIKDIRNGAKRKEWLWERWTWQKRALYMKPNSWTMKVSRWCQFPASKLLKYFSKPFSTRKQERIAQSNCRRSEWKEYIKTKNAAKEDCQELIIAAYGTCISWERNVRLPKCKRKHVCAWIKCWRQ